MGRASRARGAGGRCDRRARSFSSAVPILFATIASAAAMLARETRDRAEKKPAEPADAPDLPPIEEPTANPQAPTPPSDFGGFAAALGRGWELLAEGATMIGDKLAASMVTLIDKLEAGAYTVGEWTGWLVACSRSRILLTKGASAVATSLPKLAKLLSRSPRSRTRSTRCSGTSSAR